MKTLVTGGGGFVGSHLVDRLIGDGHEVVVLDNFVTGRPANLAHLADVSKLTLFQASLIDPLPDELTAIPFDRVYNLASPASPRDYGLHPIQTHLVNSLGAYNVLNLAAAHNARFLQSSTSEVYGDPLVHPQPESYWGNVNSVGPRSCYDEGKRFAESLTMEYYRQHMLDVRIPRIFNTYGPRNDPRDGRVVPNFCMQALQGKPITIYGDGSQTRSFCYVDDLVSGLVLLMETEGLGGEVVNLGNPIERTIQEFAEIVVAISGSNSRIVYEPLPQDDPARRRPDIARAQRLLGWTPKVALEDGLRRTLEYFAPFAHSSA